MFTRRARLALFITILLFFILALTTPLSSSAQGQPTPTKNPDCKPAALIEKAAKLTSSKDDKKDLDALLKLAADISAQNIACNGLKFSGSGNKLLGPFDLPEGTWKLTVTTKGYFIAKAKTISGECDDDTISSFLFMSGQASDGAGEVVESKGCRLTIAISNISAPWTLTFEPLE